MEKLEPLQHLKFVSDKSETYLKIHSTMSVLVKAGYSIKKRDDKPKYDPEDNHYTIYYKSVAEPDIRSDYIFMDFTLISIHKRQNYYVTILIEGTPGGKVTTYLSEKAELEID